MNRILPFLLEGQTCTPRTIPSTKVFGVWSFNRYYCWTHTVAMLRRVSDGDERHLFFAPNDVKLSDSSIMSDSGTSITNPIDFLTWRASSDIEVVRWEMQTPDNIYQNNFYLSLSIDVTNPYSSPFIARSGVITTNLEGDIALETNNTLLGTNGGIFPAFDDNLKSTLVMETSNTVADARSFIFANGPVESATRYNLRNDRKVGAVHATVITSTGNYQSGLQSQKDNSSNRLSVVVKTPVLLKSWADADAPTSAVVSGTHLNNEFYIGAQSSNTVPSRRPLTGFIKTVALLSGDAEEDGDLVNIQSHFNTQ